jgi:hypothetical protein
MLTSNLKTSSFVGHAQQGLMAVNTKRDGNPVRSAVFGHVAHRFL